MTVIVTRPVEEPIPVLDHCPSVVWMSPTITLAGFGRMIPVPAPPGPDRFTAAESGFRQWLGRHQIDDRVARPGSGPLLFASMAFDENNSDNVAVIPEIVVGSIDGRWFVTTVGEVDPAWLYHPAGSAAAATGRPRYAGASIPDLRWLEAVDTAIDLIKNGEFEKVVLARDYAVWARSAFDPRAIIHRLHTRFPGCFVFAVENLVGASPELLIRVNGLHAESVTLAGTIKRSDDPAEDAALADHLLGSEKDLMEHELAVRSVESVLAPRCERLLHDPQPVLMDLANVRHLATRFHGRLTAPASALQMAGALHPTAAVGGWPAQAGMDAIRRLEGMNRGRYAGPVGWIDRHGNGEFAIALRCAELSGARARLFAGAGIVEGSLPEDELDETRIKLQAMLHALDPEG